MVDFREGTFFGELAFDNGTTVSARPSDAIALAVRCQVPVFVEEAVLDEAGIVVTDDDDEEESAVEDAETPRTRSSASASSSTRSRRRTSDPRNRST